MLAALCAASPRARGAELASDPFATKQGGFDTLRPTLESFEKSLPPATRPAGREVRVELAVRESATTAKTLVPEIKPPADLVLDPERDPTPLRVKLNTAAWADDREWIKTDPAGQTLAEPLWTGRVLCVRPGETDEAGYWRLDIVFCAAGFEGWVETTTGEHQPVMTRRTINTNVTLPPNRWLALGGLGGGEGKPHVVYWLRIADDSVPAGDSTVPLFAEPSKITPPSAR